MDTIDVDADETEDDEIMIIDEPVSPIVEQETKYDIKPEEGAGFLADRTTFQFTNGKGTVVRTRPFLECDTVGKLFGQATMANVLQARADQHTLSAKINEDEAILVFRGDHDDFDNLLTAIKSHPSWEVNGKGAKCDVEIALVET